MNVYKENSKLATKLSKVEALMQELQLTVEWSYNGYLVTDRQSGQKGYVRDVESEGTSTALPRMFDSERLVVPAT